MNLCLDSVLAHLDADLGLAQPFLAGFVDHDEGWLSLGNLWLVGSGFLGSGSWSLSDGIVGFGVQLGDGLGTRLLESLSPFAELLLKGVSVSLLELSVVSLNVLTENVCSVLFGVVGSLSFLLLNCFSFFADDNFSLGEVITWESLFIVRNVETTIASTFQGTEDSVTSGGAGKTDIEESLEWASVLDVVLN